jgi:chemotaxis protein methyltransferase CheR
MDTPAQTTHIGYGDMLRFKNLILERSGQAFPDSRQAELEAGVKRAFAASTCRDYDEYYRLLLDPVNGAAEVERLVNALTINETHFFRDAAQMEALRTRVLPDIIERRRFIRTMRIWSAGCSTGEEPYTLAIMLRDLLPDIENWSITILATDINTQALNKARVGLFTDSSFREERAKQMKTRFFIRRESRYEVVPEIQRMVTFKQLNLAEDDFPSYDTNTMLMDLIVCRNVTIYFPNELTRKLAGKFYNALAENGWLVVGHSEHSMGTYNQFQIHNMPDAILYQRVLNPDNRSLDWKQMEELLNQSKTPQTAPFKKKADTYIPPPPVSASRPVPTRPLPAVEPQPDPIQIAQELMENGENVKALQKLLALDKAEPSNPDICGLIGKIYADMGEWKSAEEWCVKTISRQKLNRSAHYILALVYQHQGRIDEAVSYMKKVIYIDASYILGHVALADLYYAQRQMPPALKSLDNARRFLSQGQPEEIVTDSGGITKRVLLDLVTHRQQQWSAESLRR